MPPVKTNVVYTMDEILIAGYANVGVVCEDTGEGGGPVAHPLTLAPDQDVTCTLTNNDTVFFEGEDIPTLNRYGLILMALLMLGIGAVGFRRFS
jgi:hypothetical protein